LRYDPAVIEKATRFLGAEDPARLLAVENLVHVLRASSLLCERLNDLLAPYGLSVAKYNLLAILLATEPEHRLPMSEIGARMSVTCANITKLVDALERENWVRRAHQPGDRRIVLAELTEEGKARLQRLMPPYYDGVRHLWAGMEPDDCLELTHLLLKLRASLAAAPQEGLEETREDEKDDESQ
jgi:MarR family transcriptional repressor of emrRAB